MNVNVFFVEEIYYGDEIFYEEKIVEKEILGVWIGVFVEMFIFVLEGGRGEG